MCGLHRTTFIRQNFFFHHVGPGNQNQVTSLGGESLYLVSCSSGFIDNSFRCNDLRFLKTLVKINKSILFLVLSFSHLKQTISGKYFSFWIFQDTVMKIMKEMLKWQAGTCLGMLRCITKHELEVNNKSLKAFQEKQTNTRRTGIKQPLWMSELLTLTTATPLFRND